MVSFGQVLTVIGGVDFDETLWDTAGLGRRQTCYGELYPLTRIALRLLLSSSHALTRLVLFADKRAPSPTKEVSDEEEDSSEYTDESEED